MERHGEGTRVIPPTRGGARGGRPGRLLLAGLAGLAGSPAVVSPASAQDAPLLDVRPYEFETRSGATHAPRGRHLLIHGAAHSDELLLSSPAIGTRIRDFLAGEEIPSGSLAVPFDFAVPEGDPGRRRPDGGAGR